MAAQRTERTRAALTWGVTVAALLVPVIGLVAGLACLPSASPALRSTGRLWLVAGLCSGLAYLVVMTR